MIWRAGCPPLYMEEVEVSEDTQGAIYLELRRSGDRYTDKEILALGGMKKVSRIFDSKTGRHVAMAELRAEAPSELFETFLREARLTALLEHPNIISVHDIGLSPEGLPFFTMDLKKGDSLATILKKNRLSRNALLEIFIKLCDALSYAHSQKVMHLDLKPENIQIGRFGEVFICDWGLSKISGSDESEGKEFDEILFNPDLLNNMTLSGQVKGTPGYMAPEQIEKKCRQNLSDGYLCLRMSAARDSNPTSSAEGQCRIDLRTDPGREDCFAGEGVSEKGDFQGIERGGNEGVGP